MRIMQKGLLAPPVFSAANAEHVERKNMSAAAATAWVMRRSQRPLYLSLAPQILIAATALAT
jgi:hypothetical protein